jgi:hypothetical protein
MKIWLNHLYMHIYRNILHIFFFLKYILLLKYYTNNILFNIVL